MSINKCANLKNCLTQYATMCYYPCMNILLVEHAKREASRVAISADNKRVAITLPGQVVEVLQKMADKEMRSLSSMTALMVVRGLEQELEEHPVQKAQNGKGK